MTEVINKLNMQIGENFLEVLPSDFTSAWIYYYVTSRRTIDRTAKRIISRLFIMFLSIIIQYKNGKRFQFVKLHDTLREMSDMPSW